MRTSADGAQPAGTDGALALRSDGDGSPSEVARLVALARALAEKNAQLEHALQSRIAIEQAKGVLAERLSVGVDEAFEVLRTSARSNRLRIHDLARRVVDERTTPAEIVASLAGDRS